MNKLYPIATFLFMLASGGLLQAGTPATVLEVEDGDTLLVEVAGNAMRVQLLGIDAPEDVENPKLVRDRERTGLTTENLLELGRQATAHLSSMLSTAHPLELVGDMSQRDKYGRTNLIVNTSQGGSLNERMIAAGYAVVLDRSPMDAAFRERLEKLESDAVGQQRGLWGGMGEAALKWRGISP